MVPRGCARAAAPGSVDRGDEATGGSIECEAAVLPRGALTQSRQPLHVSPDGPWIRLVLLCQSVRLGGLLLRHIESPHHRLEHRFTILPEFLGRGLQKHGATVRGIRVEGCAKASQRGRPRILNRRPNVPAPEAGHMLESP